MCSDTLGVIYEFDYNSEFSYRDPDGGDKSRAKDK